MELGVSERLEERPRRAARARQVRLVLPYPPSTNALRAIFTPKKGRARLLDTELGRAYKQAVRLLLEAAGARFRWTEPLLLEVDVFRPMRSGDLGNREKVLSDALQTEVERLRSGAEQTHSGLFEDDEQTVEIHMRRYEDKSYPRVQVTVSVVSGPAGLPPEAWPRPPRWEQALAMVEAAQEKRRTRERKKDEAKAKPQPALPAYLQPLPAGSNPGTPSYGSRHWPKEPGTKSPAPRQLLANLARPASYRPLPRRAGAGTTAGPEAKANRGNDDDE